MLTAEQVYDKLWDDLNELSPVSGELWKHRFILPDFQRIFTLTMTRDADPTSFKGQRNQIRMLFSTPPSEPPRPSDGDRLDASIYRPQPGATVLRGDTKPGPWFEPKDGDAAGSLGLKQVLVDFGRGPKNYEPGLMAVALGGLPTGLAELPPPERL
ncbi:MAG TPA: hypothetical protein VFB59_03695 [Candidatus Saccharimonadales bacterium]|nr:hypothetical protein [Candidatus Saccharimonadales bacterium]